MSILKALQKKQSELAGEAGFPDPSKVVPFERKGRGLSTPPPFAGEEFKIGTPSSAFIGQSDSLIGMALPDSKPELSAGATLNAVSSARPASSALPDFVRWTVEAERVESRIVAINQPNSPYCEEYRNLRTQILHKAQRQKLQSLVVASANPGEGKSVTALNLSWLLAQTDGISCLVIDSDLRKPSLADYLGIEVNGGLSSVLSGNATLADSIIRLEPSGLHLLPGGEPRSDVAELISGPKFRDILRQAREMFDFVIIDAPPLGIFTDATVLINHADAAMLVVRAGMTKYSALDRILETIPRERMLGVLLNDSEDVLEESGYGYRYNDRNSKVTKKRK